MLALTVVMKEPAAAAGAHMSNTAESDPRVRSLLEQLRSFSPLDPGDLSAMGEGSPGVTEIGVAWDEEGPVVLLSCSPSSAEVSLRGGQDELRAMVSTNVGLLRLPLLEAPGLTLEVGPTKGRALRLPTRETSVPRPAPVQGLDVVEQALTLGSDRDAVARLHDVARSETSPVRARLALEAAEAIDALIGQQRSAPASPWVGRCDAVLAWRSWCGLVTVRAPLSRDAELRPDLDPELAAGLERGGQLGRAMARRVRGLPPGAPAAPPMIERAESVAKLGDPGGTLALAAALAACSRELEVPLPSDVIALGGLDDQGRVAPLARDRFAHALQTIARERPGVRVVAAIPGPEARPLATNVKLVPVSTLEDAVRLTFGELRPTPAADPRLLDEAELDEREYRHEEALAKARQFLAHGQGTPAQRLRGQWLEGACLVHLGRPEEALTAFDLAWRLARDPQRAGTIDRAVAVYLALAEADGLTDLFRYGEALARLEQGRELAGSSVVFLSKFDYFQGLVLVHAGRAREAIVLLERACAHALPADAPRFRCWLGLALTEIGDHSDAVKELERGLALVVQAGGAAVPFNRAYLLLACARLELRRLDAARALACAEEGLALLRTGSYPRASLLHARGAALLLGGDLGAGLAALEEARGLGTATPFMRLVCGLAELERALALVEREPNGARTRDALRRSRELVSGYAPARARFSRELAVLAEPGPSAARALSTILRALKY